MAKTAETPGEISWLPIVRYEQMLLPQKEDQATIPPAAETVRAQRTTRSWPCLSSSKRQAVRSPTVVALSSLTVPPSPTSTADWRDTSWRGCGAGCFSFRHTHLVGMIDIRAASDEQPDALGIVVPLGIIHLLVRSITASPNCSQTERGLTSLWRQHERNQFKRGDSRRNAEEGCPAEHRPRRSCSPPMRQKTTAIKPLGRCRVCRRRTLHDGSAPAARRTRTEAECPAHALR